MKIVVEHWRYKWTSGSRRKHRIMDAFLRRIGECRDVKSQGDAWLMADDALPDICSEVHNDNWLPKLGELIGGGK